MLKEFLVVVMIIVSGIAGFFIAYNWQENQAKENVTIIKEVIVEKTIDNPELLKRIAILEREKKELKDAIMYLLNNPIIIKIVEEKTSSSSSFTKVEKIGCQISDCGYGAVLDKKSCTCVPVEKPDPISVTK